MVRQRNYWTRKKFTGYYFLNRNGQTKNRVSTEGTIVICRKNYTLNIKRFTSKMILRKCKRFLVDISEHYNKLPQVFLHIMKNICTERAFELGLNQENLRSRRYSTLFLELGVDDLNPS